jgi:2-polyprenyl-6-methoxyphenol hydroxylase-like FAD-dependent oxidoreductase
MRFVKVVNETNDSASLVFENGESVEADLVIGTDGMNSCMREYVAPVKSPSITAKPS